MGSRLEQRAREARFWELLGQGIVMQSDEVQQRAVQLADLVHLAQMLARQVHAARSADPEWVGLTQLEGATMQFIDRHPGIGTTELAVGLGLQHTNTSTALRGLEGKGLIRRERVPTDRRATSIWPTERAAENLRRVRAHWAQLLDPVPATDGALHAAVTVLEEATEYLAREEVRSGAGDDSAGDTR